MHIWIAVKAENAPEYTVYEVWSGALIPKVAEAAKQYPYADQFTLFPGPNSNTFHAWVGIPVPELGLNMPFRAIGSGHATN